MTYTKERDEFIAIATREGLSVNVARKLLRHAATLQRLAVAQCNGDWPYNGDRDRPDAIAKMCHVCNGTGNFKIVGSMSESGMPDFVKCDECNGNGKTWTRDQEADKRHDRRYVVCSNCETSGVSKAVLKRSTERTCDCGTEFELVCPDCRTSELVRQVLREASIDYWKSRDLATYNMDRTPRIDFPFTAKLGGDPRGCVLKIVVPSGATNDWGREGIAVPARER